MTLHVLAVNRTNRSGTDDLNRITRAAFWLPVMTRPRRSSDTSTVADKVLVLDHVDISKDTAARDCPSLRKECDHTTVEIFVEPKRTLVIAKDISEQGECECAAVGPSSAAKLGAECLRRSKRGSSGRLFVPSRTVT